jgi:hypothetical protein
LIVRRSAVNLQYEHHGSYLNAISGAKSGLLHALAIVVGSVGAAQVFKTKNICFPHQAAMLAGNLAQGDAQIAILAATDDGDIARNRETSPVSVGPEHD